MALRGVVASLVVLGLVVGGPAGGGLATAAGGDPPAAPEGMVLVPAGSFLMGDGLGEGKAYEQPVHEVYVSAFYMDKFEVTKALWDKVASWASSHGYDLRPSDGLGEGPAHPVTNVSWFEAVKWANARSEMEGLSPCYRVDGVVYRRGEEVPECRWGANGYRLPTEAEWEKAARGGETGRRYPWGDDIDCTRANYGDCIGTTTPVGSYPPNGYGLYDMVGNVSEWCWDWMHGGYYATSPQADPRGALSGSARVYRGGNKSAEASWCRLALRTYNPPGLATGLVGLRLVRSAP
ncbi:SUMF1/EgtB/PvdO family nonheme iron enzyme [Candidatus Bipolaricaulota bacterium]|nr:SUMF1/EgtB/PvdO family nonheme iron enzyme [Candidatus Bipolaricaulota bacterium]